MRKTIAILTVATAMLFAQAGAQSDWEPVTGDYEYTDDIYLIHFWSNMSTQTVQADYDVSPGEYFRVHGATGTPGDDAPWSSRFVECPVDNSWNVHWSGTESVQSGWALEVRAQENQRRHEWEIWKYLPTGEEYRRDSNELIWAGPMVEVVQIAGQGDPGDPGF